MAFLGIKIASDVSKLLSNIEVIGDKEDSSDFHITILFFQDNLKMSELIKSIEVVNEVVKNIKPFSVNVDTVTSFPKHDGKCAIICEIDSEELQDLNKKLRKAFDKKDIKYSTTFKTYKPHITLSYADEEIDEFKIDPIKLNIHQVELYGGDKEELGISITFPFENKKNSLLLQKANFFYKIASI